MIILQVPNAVRLGDGQLVTASPTECQRPMTLGVGVHVGEPTSPFSDWRLVSWDQSVPDNLPTPKGPGVGEGDG